MAPVAPLSPKLYSYLTELKTHLILNININSEIEGFLGFIGHYNKIKDINTSNPFSPPPLLQSWEVSYVWHLFQSVYTEKEIRLEVRTDCKQCTRCCTVLQENVVSPLLLPSTSCWCTDLNHHGLQPAKTHSITLPACMKEQAFYHTDTRVEDRALMHKCLHLLYKMGTLSRTHLYILYMLYMQEHTRVLKPLPAECLQGKAIRKHIEKCFYPDTY